MKRTIATFSSNFKPPRGTKDLFSTALFKKRAIESTTKSIIESYGITEIITPTFDKKSLFHRALGTTTDVVSKEMYVLHNTDPELVLKPEGTAAVGRAILNNINEQGGTHILPQKVWYNASFYRRERPQKGRYRQFDQFGIELVGCNHWLDDVEAILIACNVIKKLKLENRIELRINSLGKKKNQADGRGWSFVLFAHVVQNLLRSFLFIRWY